MDWPDAEMWLEGAAQSGWSVAEMRAERWESLGAPAELKPREEDIITAELDEDVVGRPSAGLDRESVAEVRDVTRRVGRPSDGEPLDDDADGATRPTQATPASRRPSKRCRSSRVRPFEDLPRAARRPGRRPGGDEAGDPHHKLAGWAEVSRDDVLLALDALKQLAVSPGRA